eukprot:3941568-Rhodomonas_salina.4
MRRDGGSIRDVTIGAYMRRDRRSMRDVTRRRSVPGSSTRAVSTAYVPSSTSYEHTPIAHVSSSIQQCRARRCGHGEINDKSAYSVPGTRALQLISPRVD